ncbi:MAG TPA: phosphonate ABC transporter, permease protein PhnE [Rhizomicrobium sp.]
MAADSITHRRDSASWRFPKPFGARQLGLAILAVLVLLYSGDRVGIATMARMSADGILAGVGLKPQSQVSSGLAAMGRSLFPLQISQSTPVNRIENFDPRHLPFLSHVETQETGRAVLNPETLKVETKIDRQQMLVEPLGYLMEVIRKLVETLEIALWGTVLAIVAAAPLAVWSARNFSPNATVRFGMRAVVSLMRAVPELISALFLVLAYGFGPIPGVLALAIHGAGFLGKFYAEDIENADGKPQEALVAAGASRLKVLHYAVLPQVMAQYIAYTLYILDRNVRMATVIGLVGAGGIGQELKGRYDMYNYGHVGTILVAIFILVVVLDQLSARLRQGLPQR